MSKRSSVRVLAFSLVTISAAAALAFQPGGERPARGPGNQPAERGPGERGPGAPGGPGERGNRPASVEGGMRQMNGALRRLSGQISDASKNEESLKLLGDMQRGCVMAKGAPIPENLLAGKDEATRSKLTAQFRADLIKVMRLLLDAEEALLSGNNTLAKSKIDEAQKIRDAGHERMGV